MERVMVTGSAGFIGYHTAARLLRDGYEVVGVDNLNAYYDVGLKEARLARLQALPSFSFEKVSIADREALQRVFDRYRPIRVIHLAAQAGVRHSLRQPHDYADANLTGFVNMLEGCRIHEVRHLLFASSSSVYGANANLPYSEHDPADHPISLYAATKKANELIAHAYAHLYGIPATGLRFFTVYGPWGRPDMAYFSFARAIAERRPITVFNSGLMKRDYTYIDDVAEGIVRLLDRPAVPNPEWSAENPDPATSAAPYRIYNIGNHEPVALLDFIAILERYMGIEAIKEFADIQSGDMLETFADTSDLRRDVGFAPGTPLETGLARFVEWFKDFYSFSGREKR
ncbi:NAD-dependent epimerase/dehydratase family protein [Cohnella sp. CFH 77786]|uniref:NAD-dependent epimerase n=1 Tax=Cohnella sp. CFH 77786 TaxID=2662265 RepID=UPI001C60A4BD|nr:NAD-dependent epimerase [Cohnella sp. CFH 77786]MBW5445652.1 NAD-dependent epimerase/dehydratase family protein [Cohnella sp. CFH 77786]